jgi:hypothetical protein
MNQDEQTTPAQNQPNLGLQDLVAVVNLIQVVAKRGAIQAEEMSVVGPLYERLIAFLQASGALNPPTVSQSAEQTADTTEPTQTGE